MKLNETDWMANSDVTMPDYIKTWRQSLRDIPMNIGIKLFIHWD